MKNFKRASAFLLTLALVLGMFPAMVFATEETTPTTVTPAATPVAGDKVLFAEFGLAQNEAWQDLMASKLSDGSKIVATWDSVYLYLVYATKGGAAATVNGKAATVTAGATYDVAKIALAQLGVAPKDYKSFCEVALAVGDATWDGFVALTKSNDLGYLRGNGSVAGNGVMSYTYKNPTIADGNQVSRVVYNSAQAATIANGVPGADAPTTIAFKLNIAELPTESRADDVLLQGAYLGNYQTAYNSSHVYGLNIYLADPFQKNGSTTITNALDRKSIEMHIFKNADGDLRLLYTAGGKYHIAELGYNISETAADLDIRAELHYTSKDSNVVDLHLYVNGKLIVVAENARSVVSDPGGSTADTYRVWVQPIFFEATGTTANSDITYTQFYDLDVTISEVAHTKPVTGAYEQVVAAGNNVLVAPRDGDAVAAFNGGAWNGLGGLLSDGTSKVFATWNADKLTLVYPTQNGAAATINGKVMSVIPGTTYDVATISLDALGLDVQTSCVEFLASFAVNGKTWVGFIYLDELTASTVNATSDWKTVRNWNIADNTSTAIWLNGTANEFSLEDTIVYDLSLAITSLPTQDPTGVKKLANTGAYANGLSFTMYDPYTNASSAKLPAAATAQWWTPVVFAKDASGKLYVAVLENSAVKYEYVNGIILDDTTTYDLDVRVEYSHESATSNVVVLKVYVNGVLIITSNNARDSVLLGSTPNPDRFGAKAAPYAAQNSGTLNLTFEVKQYVQTASAVESKNVVDAEYSITTPNDTKVWNGVAGNVPFVTLWDHDNLFFLLEGDVTPASIVVDGEELPLTNKVLTAAGNTLITVDKAFTDAVYGQTHKLIIATSTGTWGGAIRIVPTQPHTEPVNAARSNWLASQTAQLDADSDKSLATIIAGDSKTGEGAVVKFDNPGGIYFYDNGIAADGVATGKGWNNVFGALYQRRSVSILSSTADKVLTVNVAIEELASIESLTTQEWFGAVTPAMLNFVVSDAVTTQKAGLYFALYNLNGILTLGVNTTAHGIVAFPIGAMADYTNLSLRVEFSDPTPTSVSASDYSKLDATFYVNGQYVGTVENAKKIGCGNSFLAGAVMYRAVSATAGQRVAATVSDLCIDTEVNTTMPEVHTHVFDNAVVVEPTCRYDGSSAASCECGEAIVTVLPATGKHSFVYEWDETHHWMECEFCDLEETGVHYEHTATDSNCEDGLFCDDCGYEILSAGDHDYGEFEVITEATCSKDGLKRAKCTRCDSWKDEVIPATGEHAYEVTTQDATCTEDGLKTYTCECGDSYTQVIPATGHDYEGGICGNCGEEEPEVEITNGLVFKDGTYYYLKNGVAQTGAVNVTNVNGLDFATGWYRFDGPDGAISNGKININGTDRIYINGLQFKGGMYEIADDGIYYVDSNGNIVKNKVVQVVNPLEGYNTEDWYRFDADGRIYNGLFHDGTLTYFYENGLKVASKMVYVAEGENPGYYYFRDNYLAIKNNAKEITVGLLEEFAPGWYKFDEHGRLMNGFVENEYGAKMFYRNGQKVKNEMIEWEGNIYYIKPNYLMAKTAVEITAGLLEGFAPGWYKFDSDDGVLAHGFYQNDYGYNMIYYKGQRQRNCMVELDGVIYYVRINDVVGQKEVKAYEITKTLPGYAAGWYMIDTDGTLFTGVHPTNGKTYVNGVAVK